MKRLVMDLDGTLTWDEPDVPYADRRPRLDVIERLRAYREEGFEIVISTARNMRTYKGSIGLINVHTLPVVMAWLERHDVPYDEIIMAKAWCGFDGFYVDDRAVRPDEFVRMSEAEIRALLEASGRE